MPMVKRNSTTGTIDLRGLLEAMRAYNVTRYRDGEFEVVMGAVQPPREVEDFATVGIEDEDGRFDHVAMRPRREEP